MTPDRRTALVVGVLFILTFITSIGAVIAYGSVLSDPAYISSPGASTGVLVGAFLELFLIITNIGCAVVLFPILAVVTLRQDATTGDAGSLTTVGKSLVSIKNWTFLLGPGFADGIGTGLLLGWLMYRSGLVHRPMALFGVIGGPLLAISGAAVLLGVIPQGSPMQDVMSLPEIIWELYLGLWLTFKGFNAAAPILGLVGRERGIREQASAPAIPAAA